MIEHEQVVNRKARCPPLQPEKANETIDPASLKPPRHYLRNSINASNSSFTNTSNLLGSTAEKNSPQRHRRSKILGSKVEEPTTVMHCRKKASDFNDMKKLMSHSYDNENQAINKRLEIRKARQKLAKLLRHRHSHSVGKLNNK